MNKVKNALPHGSIKKIAERVNCSYFTVSRVVSGKSKNPEILKAINTYLKELNAEKVDLANTIATLQTEL